MSQTTARTSTSPPAARRAIIMSAQSVRKSFRMGETGLLVLKNIDLAVGEGEFLAIEGRSGSGKSTLMHIMGGLDAPDGGTVMYGQEDIGALASSAASLARDRRVSAAGGFMIALSFFKFPLVILMFFVDLIRLSVLTKAGRADRKLAQIRNTQFGFVFQFYHLLPELNVLENTMLSPMIENSWLSFKASQRALRERATALLKELGLEQRMTHRPSQLSGGERQRVAIARALMNNPRVLFADEPTGNLDYETGLQIMSVLERLHREKGQTIIMVTHDRAIARMADRVLVLRDGKLQRPDDPPAAKHAVETLDYQ